MNRRDLPPRSVELISAGLAGGLLVGLLSQALHQARWDLAAVIGVLLAVYAFGLAFFAHWENARAFVLGCFAGGLVSVCVGCSAPTSFEQPGYSWCLGEICAPGKRCIRVAHEVEPGCYRDCASDCVCCLESLDGAAAANGEAVEVAPFCVEAADAFWCEDPNALPPLGGTL